MVHMQTAPIKRCQMRANTRHKSNSIVFLPTHCTNNTVLGGGKKCTRQYKALDSALNSLPPCEKKKKKKTCITRWPARWRIIIIFFFGKFAFSPCSSCSSLGPGAWRRSCSAVRCDLVCSFFFFCIFSLFILVEGECFVCQHSSCCCLSTRWFPFVAFVCGCSQNMCMSSDVSVTKRQLVAAAKKTAYRGGTGGGGGGDCPNGKRISRQGGRQGQKAGTRVSQVHRKTRSTSPLSVMRALSLHRHTGKTKSHNYETSHLSSFFFFLHTTRASPSNGFE